MITRRYIVLFTIALVALLAIPGSLFGQRPRSEAELDAMVKNIAAQLRCPVCQGVSIEDSPTELA
jgi:cytochrome c-type biogenesis protein CcmH/NrfF